VILATSLQSFGMQHGHNLENNGLSPFLLLFLAFLVIISGIILYKFVSKSSSGSNSRTDRDTDQY
jgi:hypothetical protein